MIETNADIKVSTAIWEFENRYNTRPNRIIMGYHLIDELSKQFYCNFYPVKPIEELKKKFGIECRYEGILVKIDYDNPDALEVGYMEMFK